MKKIRFRQNLVISRQISSNHNFFQFRLWTVQMTTMATQCSSPSAYVAQSIDASRRSPDFNALIKAVECVEGVHAHYFTDLKRAKLYCMYKNKALGVAQYGPSKYVVYCSRYGPPYKTNALNSVKWIYLKAFYAPDNVYKLCNLKKCEHIIRKQGRIREIFVLSDHISIKLIHHTCLALQTSTKCSNCTKDNHAKCLSGSEYYELVISPNR